MDIFRKKSHSLSDVVMKHTYLAMQRRDQRQCARIEVLESEVKILTNELEFLIKPRYLGYIADRHVMLCGRCGWLSDFMLLDVPIRMSYIPLEVDRFIECYWCETNVFLVNFPSYIDVPDVLYRKYSRVPGSGYRCFGITVNGNRRCEVPSSVGVCKSHVKQLAGAKLGVDLKDIDFLFSRIDGNHVLARTAHVHCHPDGMFSVYTNNPSSSLFVDDDDEYDGLISLNYFTGMMSCSVTVVSLRVTINSCSVS